MYETTLIGFSSSGNEHNNHDEAEKSNELTKEITFYIYWWKVDLKYWFADFFFTRLTHDLIENRPQSANQLFVTI